MDLITGMPLNIVSPPPLGAKSSSPMDVASANMRASSARMSSLLNATHGGGKHRRNTLKGGAASAIVVQPLHISYPGGGALQGINTQMTSIGAQNVTNSTYDNAWVKTGGKRSYKRSGSKRSGSKRSGSKRSYKRTNKRSYKRTNKRRRTYKHSSKRYNKM
jgi:hypothetical protein